MNKKVLLFSILGGTAVLSASIVGLVFWMLGNGEKAARHASTDFATALLVADPQRAPEGTREYVSGVPAHFGKISAAEVIDARNEKRTRTRNTGGVVSSVKHRKYRPRRTSKNTTTFSVADVLVRTARGPAVLELEFTPSLTTAPRPSATSASSRPPSSATACSTTTSAPSTRRRSRSAAASPPPTSS